MRALFLLGLLFIARDCGPGSYGRCEPGYQSSAGRCVASSWDGSVPLDASSDAATVDAGPCGGSCSDDQMCNETSGRCVECITDLHCGDVAKPFCDGGSCVPCSDDDHCERFGDTPVCDEAAQRCVECTGDTESRCMPFTCDRAEGSCTDTLSNSLGPCQSCVSDLDCMAGHACVSTAFMSADTGLRCLPLREGPGCTRPFVNPRDGVISASGATVNVCVHRTTSCDAFLDYPTDSDSCTGFSEPPSASDVACGATSLDDGLCRRAGVGNRCTYVCLSDDDCPSPATCTMTTPRHCSL